MLLKMFVNMNVSVSSVLVCSTSINSVYSLALRLFGVSWNLLVCLWRYSVLLLLVCSIVKCWC